MSNLTQCMNSRSNTSNSSAFSTRKSTLKSHFFTESSPVSSVQQQVSYECQLLPLGTEYHLMEFQHCLVLQPELKHTQPQL